MKGFDYMSKSKYKNKSQTLKKYIVPFCVILGFIFIVLYINKWNEVKELEKYLNSYLLSTKTISLEMNDINQINSVLSETPSYYFVYISYTKDKNVFNFEKKLKPIIDDYNLQNNFYYINVTDIKENNKNYLNDIALELNVSESIINKVPIILYFKDGSFINSATNAKDFEDLLTDQNVRSM